MLQLAAAALAVSGLFSVEAVASFSWSQGIARRLLPCSIALGIIGTFTVALASHPGGVSIWSFLFGIASCGCHSNAASKRFKRPTRWVHRFVIYAGYGATFAGMGAAGLLLEFREASAGLATVVFVGAYIGGSALIFLANTPTVRLITKTLPEYGPSLSADPSGQNGQDYW